MTDPAAKKLRLPDAFGHPVTLIAPIDAPRALEAWNNTVMAFLAHGAQTPIHLSAALEAAPRFPLALAAKGFFMLLLGRPELRETAEQALRAAQAELTSATGRERHLTEALAHYVDGNLSKAADGLDAALTQHPGDGLLMKLAHAVRFVLGDVSGMRRSVEAALPHIHSDNPAHAYSLGCRAFALEETGAYVEAEIVGREAVRLAPDDAWGLHAVAHVMDMTARSGEGVAWIAGQAGQWDHCNNFGYHIWWHLALMHLDRGESAEVLRLYDQKIRADKTDDYRDISNAASLLSRLEIEDVEVGDRWEELASLSENRVEDGCVVFADLHYLLALGGAGRETASERLLGAMKRAAKARIGDMGAVAAETGLETATGLHAFASGDYAAAFAALSAARPTLQRIGGSHAQRDVFERLEIEAALRSGLLSEARRAIQDRVRRRGAIDGYADSRLAKIAELGAGRHGAVA